VENQELIAYAKASVSSIVLPVYYQHTFNLNPKWNLLLSAGVRLRYKQLTWKYADSDFINPDYNKFSLDLSLRPELNYEFKRSALGVYTSFNYSFGRDLFKTNSDGFYRTNANVGLIYRYYF